MTDEKHLFAMHIDDTIDPDIARAMFPFDAAMVHATEQLSYRAFRDLIYVCFGDHPDFEERMAILFEGVAQAARNPQP